MKALMTKEIWAMCAGFLGLARREEGEPGIPGKIINFSGRFGIDEQEYEDLNKGKTNDDGEPTDPEIVESLYLNAMIYALHFTVMGLLYSQAVGLAVLPDLVLGFGIGLGASLACSALLHFVNDAIADSSDPSIFLIGTRYVLGVPLFIHNSANAICSAIYAVGITAALTPLTFVGDVVSSWLGCYNEPKADAPSTTVVNNFIAASPDTNAHAAASAGPAVGPHHGHGGAGRPYKVAEKPPLPMPVKDAPAQVPHNISQVAVSPQAQEQIHKPVISPVYPAL